MRITGKYEIDSYGFITVFTEDAMYTIARKTGEWAFRRIGSWLACGGELTQELFDEWKARCTAEGTFELEED